MNWFKMAKFNDWEATHRQLVMDLGREPTIEEVQQKMMEDNFDDSNKEHALVTAKKWKDKIPGGNADGDKPSDYEKSQVERGKDIEFEHSDDPDIAKEIAMDHLEEHGDYYVGLEHMEDCLKEIEERNKK